MLEKQKMAVRIAAIGTTLAMGSSALAWVALLCNYEEERENGDLYVLKDGVAEKIEEGVSALIPRSDYEHKGVQWELDSLGNIFHTSLGNTQLENTNNWYL